MKDNAKIKALRTILKDLWKTEDIIFSMIKLEQEKSTFEDNLFALKNPPDVKKQLEKTIQDIFNKPDKPDDIKY